jgi:hypothetical protein
MDKALTTVGWGIPILIGAAVAIWARLEGIQWLQGAIFGAAGVLIVINIEDLVNQKRQRYERIMGRASRKTAAVHAESDLKCGSVDAREYYSEALWDRKISQVGACNVACRRLRAPIVSNNSSSRPVKQFGRRAAQSAKRGQLTRFRNSGLVQCDGSE